LKTHTSLLLIRHAEVEAVQHQTEVQLLNFTPWREAGL
jgi:hypothetical protein